MSATKKFRDDHVRLLSMFDELGTVLGAGEKTVAENAAEISKKLSAFGGILNHYRLMPVELSAGV